MRDDELRAIVRETVARHLRPAVETSREPSSRPALPHASHVRLSVDAGGSTAEGVCFIEPAVRCHHCGYCQSYGH